MVCLLASWMGCGKRSDTSSPSGEAAAKAAAAEATQIAALLKELTQAVRKFGVEQRRVPKNLEELVANGYLPGMPPAPAGKQFAIDKNLQVTLVNR